jgi:hypothetical protein
MSRAVMALMSGMLWSCASCGANGAVAALIGNQIVQMRQTGEKCCVTPGGVIEAFHGE